MSDQAPRPTDVAGEVDRLERDFYRIYSSEPAALDAIVPRARATGDTALLGRSLSLLSRAQIGRGRHAEAVVTARAGLDAFDGLGDSDAATNLAARAELLRTAGNAQLKLGHSGAALPLLEEAVACAERALAAPGSSPADVRRARLALVRGLNNLGNALLAVRELDTAIDIYERVVAVGATFDRDDGMLDDLLLARWNSIDALHERVKRSRAAGDSARADTDLQTVRLLLENAAELLTELPEHPAITGYARQGYYSASGRYLLLTGKPAEALAMFERQIEAISREPGSGMYEWVVATAHAGMAQATLALGLLRDALRHCTLALSRFDRHDEASERAPVLLVRADALSGLGEYEAAYAELEAYHALRSRLEAEAAQQYAGHLTAKLGLERARAEAESHRHIAATLETLGRIGQEITANLDAEAVMRILYRNAGTLLAAEGFSVWLLDAAGEELTLAFGIEDGRPFTSQPIAAAHPSAWVARAVRERREFVGTAPAPDREATAFAGTRFMQSAMFAPLIVGDRVLGALTIQSDRPNAYGENERSILRTLCTYGAIALDNAAAYRELGHAVARLEMTQQELSIRTAEFERLSMTDALTAVPNRRHFMERAAIEFAEARRGSGDLAVAMLDIDHFKQVNDRYGHVAGDRVLQRIALVAKEGLRSADFLARIGGEEFALLLPGAGAAEARAVAERIRIAIEAMIVRVETLDLRVTASFGVANFTSLDATFDQVFGRADEALYRSKQSGRNRVTADP